MAPAHIRDDTATLLAAGVLAYVTETLAHEALGHGGVCLATGKTVLLVAPLWMRCSDVLAPMVAAGPAANAIAAACCAALLWLRPPTRPVLALLLWLGFAFNVLVAAGYLGVGALTGFGDWPFLFAGVSPPLAWRIPAGCIAIAAYAGCLSLAAALFRRQAGVGALARTRLWRRSMAPAAGAALVACLAEIYGGRAQPGPLLLALGCTLAVGLSLTNLDNAVARETTGSRDLGPVPRTPWLIAVGLAAGTLFVLIIGPGLKL
jgi:hypothetical protein